jgi:hypothetical protein
LINLHPLSLLHRPARKIRKDSVHSGIRFKAFQFTRSKSSSATSRGRMSPRLRSSTSGREPGMGQLRGNKPNASTAFPSFPPTLPRVQIVKKERAKRGQGG